MKFLDTMAEHNHVGILTFSSGINKKVEIGPVPKTKFDLAAVVESSKAGGGTALYDAVKAAVEMADKYPLPGEAIRGVVLLTDGDRTDGKVKLSDQIELRTAQEQAVGNFVGEASANKTDLHGYRLAGTTAHPIHIFSIAYGKDADLEVLRIFSEATNSTFNKADPKNVTTVLEIFGKYF